MRGLNNESAGNARARNQYTMEGRFTALSTRPLCVSAVNLAFYEQLTWHAAERLGALLGHPEAFADLDAPVGHPDRGDAVEGHIGLQHGLVAGAQAGGVLAPIRRIVAADGVADARFLLDAVPADDAAPGRLDLLAGGAGIGGGQGGVEALDHHLLGVHELLRGLAEEHRARLRAVIAVAAGAELEDR